MPILKFGTVYRHPRLIALVGLLALLTSRCLAGQPVSVEASAGVALPRGSMNRYRGVGPLVRAGVVLGKPSYAVRLRLDYESAWIPGDEPESNDGARHSIRIRSLLGSGLIKVWDKGATGYVILGGGMARVPGDSRKPHLSVFTARAGVGVRHRMGRFGWQVEVAPSLVFTDYISGSNYESGLFVPITAGVFF